MDKSKAFTMYYFSIDGRNGLAKVNEGLFIETDEQLETYLRSVAVAVTADVERLVYTYRLKDVTSQQKLACLLSLQNIIDSDVKVLSCNGDGVVIRRDIVAVKDVFNDYVLYILDDAPDEFKAHFDDVKCFVSTIKRKIRLLESMVKKEKIEEEK